MTLLIAKWLAQEKMQVWSGGMEKGSKHDRNADRCNEWEGMKYVKVPETKESKVCERDRGDIIMAEEMDNTDSSQW